MAHAVSASYARSDHMPPVAALLAALLHAATALALFWVSPLNRHDLDQDAIQVTLEEPKPPQQPPVQEATPQPAATTAPPPPPAAAAPKPEPQPQPQVQATSKEPLGVSPPAPEAKRPDEPKPQPPQEAKLEPQKPADSKPPPAQEATAEPAKPAETPPAADPPLEKVVPPVETPAAPLTMRDFVKVLPPPPAPRTAPPAQPTPQQHQQQQALQHSPLSTAPSPPSSSGASVSSFVNPAEASAQTRAKDTYLWQVIRKFSQYLPDLREKNEGGTVVLRFVIARDGRLVEASIAKSSGVVALDRGLLESLRAASPYPPLPAEIPGDQVVFVQPIGAARR